MSDANSQKVWVVIPAAGVGRRMQSDTPKQYLKINEKTILEHTIECFLTHPNIAGFVIALHSEDPYWNRLNINPESKPLYTVEGGKERSDSVLQALNYLLVVEQLPKEHWIMIHDAARPMLKKVDIDRLLELCKSDSVGGILASPVRDTMKRSEAMVTEKTHVNFIKKTEPRDNLWHAQTPQLFRLGALEKALQSAYEKGVEITDEASAMEAMGEQPALIEGCSSNIKITRPADYELAKLLLTPAPRDY